MKTAVLIRNPGFAWALAALVLVLGVASGPRRRRAPSPRPPHGKSATSSASPDCSTRKAARRRMSRNCSTA